VRIYTSAEVSAVCVPWCYYLAEILAGGEDQQTEGEKVGGGGLQFCQPDIESLSAGAELGDG
jgi:hypothetical protein